MTEPDATRTPATCLATPGALDSGTAGAVWILTYLLVVCVPAAGVAIEEWEEGALSALGKATGVAGLSILLLQPLLAGRIRAFSRPFGYDRVLLFHKTMALIALVLIAAHPVLIAAGYQYWALLGLETGWTVWLGKGALLLLLGVVVGPMAHTLFKLDYQIWRTAHKGAICVALLGAAHMWFMTDELGMRIGFGVLLVMGGGVFLWRNAVLPFARRRMRVARVTRETHDTWTLDLAPDGGNPIPQLPGQFLFLKLYRKGHRSEEHPFTIASAPGQGDSIQVTIKESGGYTRTIGETRAGDTARIEGPLGRFSYLLHRPEATLLFIAGGVGITPVISMIRHLRGTNHRDPVTLIFANKTEEDILFRDELEALPENFTIVHVLSEADEEWQGPKGFVDASCIEKFVPESARETTHTYVCGPPAMMRKVIAALRGLGVSNRYIHYEKFGL